MKYQDEQELGSCVAAWLISIGIIFGACLLGLILSVLQGLNAI